MLMQKTKGNLAYELIFSHILLNISIALKRKYAHYMRVYQFALTSFLEMGHKA